MKHNSMSIPDTFSNVLIYICKRQKLKQTRTEKSNREKKKGDAIEKKAEEEKRMNKEKKLKFDTRARRDTIENTVRVKSKRVRGMSR